MRILLAIPLVVGLALPASAQRMKGGARKGMPDQNAEQRKKKDLELDRAAKAAMDSLRDKKFDAWGGVRGTTTPGR